MLESKAVPVTPVRAVSNDQAGIDEAVSSGDSRNTTVDDVRGRASEAGNSSLPAKQSSGNPVTATAATPAAGPSAAFVTQSISQEVMGAGLYIEPWNDAISAYRRADAGPDRGSMVSSISV